MVEQYWNPDWVLGDSKRYCKVFRRNLDLNMNPDNTYNWIKCMDCIKACKKADDNE